MAKFFSRFFKKSSSFSGSESSLNDTQSRSKLSTASRTATSFENLASYNVISKELEKNKLHKAAWEGNMQKVALLARPGQINLKDSQQRTPLHLAVVKGHIEIVRYLVQNDAKLDIVDNDQRTPLIKAVLSGNQNPQRCYQICHILIEGGSGSYINAVDKQGRNALHYAIVFGNEHIVQLLLSNENCDPNIHDRDQMTPLHLAIKRNSPTIVQLLLSEQREQQADPNIPNRYGQTPLHLAASVGYVDIVRLLVTANLKEPCDPTILDAQQLTAYQQAKTYHQEMSAKLIEDYEKRYQTNYQRQTTTASSIHEQLSMRATTSLTMTPAANLQNDHDDTSDNSISISTSKPSKISAKRTRRSSDQWSDDVPSISETKQEAQTISNLFKNNPLQVEQKKENHSTINNLFSNNPLQTNNKKTTPKSQPTKSTSFFGIGPVIERVDSDNTSSISVQQPVGISSNKPSTTNHYVNTAHQPASNAKSWSDDTITTSPKKKKPEPISNNSWDTSVSDDDTTVSQPIPIKSNLQKTKVLSPSTANLTSSDTDDNSVNTKIRKVDVKKPANGTATTVQNLVNKPTGNSYKVIGLPEAQSPADDDSTWTTTPVPFNEKLPNKGIQNLVHKPKTDDSTWDDSQPASVDKKQQKDSDDDDDLSSILRSVEAPKTKQPTIENLIRIMDTIMHTNKKQPSPKVHGKFVVSSMIRSTESTTSENSLRDVDNDAEYEQSWKKQKAESPRKDSKPLSIDTHNIRSSISSTKSSFNEAQIHELKENIRKLEQNQDDIRDLKRQLKDMEFKKNDFEKLYKENNQMLRDTENKLDQEKHDKQRLERTTKDLNSELENIKHKLRSLESEKDRLNQRCTDLQQERDKHDESSSHSLQSTTRSSSQNDYVHQKTKSQHREASKLPSIESNVLQHRTKPNQSNEYSTHYKIDLEKALEEKSSYQHELERLKHEKERIEQEKLEYKIKYDGLQEEIRAILFDRTKLEQKLTTELQEHLQEKQRSTDSLRKYRREIEELNMKLDDAETRLTELQTQNQTLISTNNRNITNQVENVVKRLYDTQPTYMHQPNKSQQQESHHVSHDSLAFHPSTSFNNRTQYQYFNKTFPQQPQYKSENILFEKSQQQLRSNTERVKDELDRLRQDFDQLISSYDPNNNYSNSHTKLHSHIDTFRQVYQQEFRERQLLMSKLTNGNKSKNYDQSSTIPQRPYTTMDTNSTNQRVNVVTEIPRQASALLTINTTNNGVMSSIELFRKHNYV